MLKDYLLFIKQKNHIRSLVIEDIKYFVQDWHHNGPDTYTFYRVDNRRNHVFNIDDIIKLYAIQYIEDEVILKELVLSSSPKEHLKCYFAHSWRSKDHPDKFRILEALKKMKIEVIDPFVGEDDLCFQYDERDYYPNCNYKLGRAIWVKDLAQIRDCDMFLMWVDSSAPGRFMGTSYELAYAFGLGKHIQIISDLRHPCMAYVLCHGNRQYDTIEDFEHSRRIRWK